MPAFYYLLTNGLGNFSGVSIIHQVLSHFIYQLNSYGFKSENSLLTFYPLSPVGERGGLGEISNIFG
jgi:hypothetical protein